MASTAGLGPCASAVAEHSWATDPLRANRERGRPHVALQSSADKLHYVSSPESGSQLDRATGSACSTPLPCDNDNYRTPSRPSHCRAGHHRPAHPQGARWSMRRRSARCGKSTISAGRSAQVGQRGSVSARAAGQEAGRGASTGGRWRCPRSARRGNRDRLGRSGLRGG